MGNDTVYYPQRQTKGRTQYLWRKIFKSSYPLGFMEDSLLLLSFLSASGGPEETNENSKMEQKYRVISVNF